MTPQGALLERTNADGERKAVCVEKLFLKFVLSGKFCLFTDPLSFSLRLPKQEASSSAFRSFDKKSKLPRTSSTTRVSCDDELLSSDRSFWEDEEEAHSQWARPRVFLQCVNKYTQVPSVWWPSAGSGGPGLSAPCRSSCAPATSSPAPQ